MTSKIRKCPCTQEGVFVAVRAQAIDHHRLSFSLILPHENDRVYELEGKTKRNLRAENE